MIVVDDAVLALAASRHRGHVNIVVVVCREAVVEGPFLSFVDGPSHACLEVGLPVAVYAYGLGGANARGLVEGKGVGHGVVGLEIGYVGVEHALPVAISLYGGPRLIGVCVVQMGVSHPYAQGVGTVAVIDHGG